jgi:hypothetical protein
MPRLSVGDCDSLAPGQLRQYGVIDHRSGGCHEGQLDQQSGSGNERVGARMDLADRRAPTFVHRKAEDAGTSKRSCVWFLVI